MKKDTTSVYDKARSNLKRGRSPLRGLTEREIIEGQTCFSAFEDAVDARGFVDGGAHRVDRLETPRPYLHLMSSPHARGEGVYGSFWDQTGRGFSCLDSVLAGPVTSHLDTSYVPTCPTDTDYRAFYVREEAPKGEATDMWFLLPQPGRDEEAVRDFSCRQGLGETEISAESRGIRSNAHVFVVHDDPVEIWTLRLKNTTRRRRRLLLFTRVNWGLRSYPGYYFDMRVVCCGLYDARNRAVAAFNRDQNNTAPRSGLLMSDAPVSGYDLSREAFDGNGVFRNFPQAVVEGRCRNSLGEAPYAGMIGALQQTVTIEPGGEKTVRFVLGAASADIKTAAAQRTRWRKKYLAPGAADKALARIRTVWRKRCRANMIQSGDAETDRFFNVWSKYQASHQARFIRALDMMGYRDVLQDIMGICDFDPAYVRGELLRALSYQLPDGRAIRQYCKFPGAAHDLRMYMDSPVWIPDTLTTYLKETGDWSVLDEPVGFFDLERKRHMPGKTASVYEHALLAVQSCYRLRGQKGLCLVGHGDWNDALDGIGRGGRGVSVWLTVAVIHAARIMRELALRLGRKKDAAAMAAVAATLTRNVNRSAWDGKHYVYGFDDKGRAIGARSCAEGRIHLNVNSWALFTGVARAGGGAERERAVLAAIETLNTPLGYRLLTPPYTARSKAVGRIADMLPGLFENGSIYTHGQSFVTAALLELGRGDDAWESMKRTMPSRTLPQISTQPPHQQSNFTVGPDNADFGKNYYNNFTGSLNWYRKNLMRMFGVMADYDGLKIDPCLPSFMRRAAVEKDFRGCRYRVEILNPDGVSRGVKSMVVDGMPLKSRLVPLSAKRACTVVVTMG